MSNHYYHGYWFYGLRKDEIIQAKDAVEEYTILNRPQEYMGPFPTRFEAWEFKSAHPKMSEEFNKQVQEMMEAYFNV